MQMIESTGALQRLQNHLDVYRCLERYVSVRGEAYPGEAVTIGIHIRCLSKSISLHQTTPAGQRR